MKQELFPPSDIYVIKSQLIISGSRHCEPVLNVVWVMFPITLTLSGFVYLRMREYHNLFMFEFVEREFDWTVETSKWVFTFLLKVEKPINLFVYS